MVSGTRDNPSLRLTLAEVTFSLFLCKIGIWYFVDWTGLDWTGLDWTSKTRTRKTRTSKTRTGKTWTGKTITCTSIYYIHICILLHT